MPNSARIIRCAMALVSMAALVSLCFMPSCAAINTLPARTLKTPPTVQETSVSTYVPSASAPSGGLAVNVIYPSFPRYKNEGAPLVVVVPGYNKASGLTFSMGAVQVGFAEVRFAFPGGGLKKFHSGGSWDGRGPDSQTALKDVLLFTRGLKKDYKGRTISELVPARLNIENIGMVGWHDGANIALVTLSRFASETPFVKWLAFYESPVGTFFTPAILGTTRELFLNKRYKQGSAATGRCNVDLKNLRWQPDVFRDRSARTHKALPTPKGVVFFDDNDNRKWDELTEFPLNYAIEPGVEKQFYAPEITAAMKAQRIFSVVQYKTMMDKKTGKPVLDKKTGEPKLFYYMKELWPPQLATPRESEEFFRRRDGSLYIKDIARKYPHLMVTLFASNVDHEQQQPDHPHIAMTYNAFLDANTKWVRLNPSPRYAGFTADMNPSNFINNAPNKPIEASAIEKHLEPEGLISDKVYMQAAIAELADRTKHQELTYPLTGVLESYMNEAAIRKAMAEHQEAIEEKARIEKQPPKEKLVVHLELGYTSKSNDRQSLDLHLPRLEPDAKAPVVVWIHGGGWKSGSKQVGPFKMLVENGFAVASINYRYSTQAPFPAQLLDCKQAIRWLKDHASEYNLDPGKIGVWGASSGGYLAAMLAVTSGTDTFKVASSSKSTSDIQAACDWFGPVDLALMLEDGKRKLCDPRVPKEIRKLLQGDPGSLVSRARAASPISYVNQSTPPILIMHGEADKVVPLVQSENFTKALEDKGAPVTLEVITEKGHDLADFGSKYVEQVVRFFQDNLK